MKYRLMLILLTFLLLLSGCQKSSPIVGKWKASERGSGLTLEINPDNTIKATFTLGAINQSAEGKWSQPDDRQITIEYSNQPKSAANPVTYQIEMSGSDSLKLIPPGGKGIIEFKRAQ